MLLNRTSYFKTGRNNINKQIDFITIRINNKDDSYPKNSDLNLLEISLA
ncbi:MAG: hypothetical protein ACJAXY_001693 [Nonlabens sp.]|jgi:hypothetical protein